MNPLTSQNYMPLLVHFTFSYQFTIQIIDNKSKGLDMIWDQKDGSITSEKRFCPSTFKWKGHKTGNEKIYHTLIRNLLRMHYKDTMVDNDMTI